MLRLGLVSLTLCALGIVALAATSTASVSTKKQRIVMDMKERPGTGTFELKPDKGGPLKEDSGTYTWRIISKKSAEVDGQYQQRVVADVTYVGENGTFVAREIDTLVDVVSFGSKRVATGTWKLLRGTGAYAEVRGSGRLAAVLGVVTPSLWRYEGHMTSL